MKYRPVIPSLLLCALLFVLLSGCGVGETKPFTDLKAEDITSVALEYVIDSKGYYQPVYILTVLFDGDAVVDVPISVLD